MSLFQNCKLVISARSPFARRVRLAFHEHGVCYEEEVVDVFNPPTDFKKTNPLLRVPAVKLKNGAVIVDSHEILAGFYSELKESPFFPRSPDEWQRTYLWSGIAVGLCEKTVEYYLETVRPANLQDATVFQEMQTITHNVLSELENTLTGPSLIEGIYTQADLDLGSALDYFCLRHSTDWQGRYTKVASYLDGLRLRKSFQATKPPGLEQMLTRK